MHFALGLLLLLGLSSPLVGPEEPMGQQVVQAVSPLPEAVRDGATVLSHRGPDGRKLLREGSRVVE